MKVLIKEQAIIKRMEEIGHEITNNYKDKEITLVVTLKGAFMTAAELVKHISGNVLIEFIKVSSYAGKESTGTLKYTMDLEENLNGKNIILIEDIIDTGLTLYNLKKEYIKRGANVEIMSLLDKPSKREHDIQGDYVGFSIEDKFVIGYGLDYDGLYRELPYIAEMD